MLVLSIIKEAQNEKGLKDLDYNRYRQYCTRRLQRIRQALDFTHGKGKSFIPKQVAVSDLNNVRFLELVLFGAERAWSYAMQLNEESKVEIRRKHHAKMRMKKAVEQATLLSQLACDSEHIDLVTKMESQAYASWMEGNYHFMQQEWISARQKFSASKALYEKLRVLGSSDEEILCASKISEIEPSIKYCDYQLSLAKQKIPENEEFGIAAFSEEYQKYYELKVKQNEANKQSIQWNDVSIKVENESMALLLLQLEKFKATPEKSTVESFITCTENLKQQSEKQLQNAKLSKQPASKIKNNENLILFANVENLNAFLCKCMLLQKEYKKTSITAELLLQKLEYFKNFLDSLESVEEIKIVLIPALSILSKYAAVLKNFMMANYFMEQTKFTEAKGFIESALESLEIYQKFYDESLLSKFFHDKWYSQPSAMKSEVERLHILAKAKFQLYKYEAVNEKGIIMNSDVALDSLDNVSFTIPSKVMPVSAPPIFFDLAFNEIQAPVLDEKKGLTGLFSSLWKKK